MRIRLSHLLIATTTMAVLLAGQHLALLAGVLALIAYMTTLTVIFGKQ